MTTQKRKRPRYIQVYLADEVYEQVRRAAFDARESLSDYLRKAAQSRLNTEAVCKTRP